MERKHYNFITVLFITAFFGVATTASAAPKWKKVNVGAATGGGSTGSASGGDAFSCVTSISSTRVLPATATAALDGIVVNYIVIGGGGGSGFATAAGQRLAGNDGEIRGGIFTVQANTAYTFYVAGGGASSHSTYKSGGGGGGSSAILADSTPVVIASGGDGGGCPGSRGSNSGGAKCNLNGGTYPTGGGTGYYGGGSATEAGAYLRGAVGANNALGGGFGAAGRFANGSFGVSSSQWADIAIPKIPSDAGLGAQVSEERGGNSGAIILSYKAMNCIM